MKENFEELKEEGGGLQSYHQSPSSEKKMAQPTLVSETNFSSVSLGGTVTNEGAQPNFGQFTMTTDS